MKKNNTKILIIGNAGYIGTVLTDYLLESNYFVRGFDLCIYNNHQTILPFLSKPNYEFCYGDLRDENALKKALKDIIHVVLLAGLVGDPITKKYSDFSEKVNYTGLINAINLIRNFQNIERVIFVSTCSNYGLIKGDELADECHELKPLSLYAKAKVAVEQHLLGLSGKIHYTPIILRFATAFGLSPRMRFDLTINEFTKDLYCGKNLLVYDAKTWRPYCHVVDFAHIIRKTLEAPLSNVAFQVFNAGGDVNNNTKQMIVDQIQLFIPNSNITYKEHGTDPRNYRVDFRKIKDILEFEPQYTVQDGIQEILQALKQHLFDKIEKNKDFYGNYTIDIN